MPTLCGSFLGLAGLYFLLLAGSIDMDLNNNIGGLFLPFAMTMTGSIFTTRTSPNAVTNQRSLAHRHLHNQKGFWPMFTGLDIFMVYMLLTVLIMVLGKSNSAE